MSPAFDEDSEFRTNLDEQWPPLGSNKMGNRIDGAFARGHAGYGFTGSAALDYGGTSAAPVTLKAVDPHDALLDGVLDLAEAKQAGSSAKKLDRVLDAAARGVLETADEAPRPPPFSHHSAPEPEPEPDRETDWLHPEPVAAVAPPPRRRAVAPPAPPPPPVTRAPLPKKSVASMAAAAGASHVGAKLRAKAYDARAAVAAAPRMKRDATHRAPPGVGPVRSKAAAEHRDRRKTGWGTGQFDSFKSRGL